MVFTVYKGARMTGPATKTERAQLESDIRSENRELAWRAVTAIKKLLRASPKDALLLDFLGRAMCVLGDATASETAHRRAIKLQPENEMRWFNFAVSLWKLDRHTQSIDTMERAAALTDTWDLPSFYLARWYSFLERPDLALHWIERSVRVAPGPSRLVWLALIQNELGNIGEAQESLRRAYSAFALERFTDWQPSAEAGISAFASFVESGAVAGPWGPPRLARIVHGQPSGIIPLEADPQIIRLRSIAESEPAPKESDLDPTALLGSYEELLPLIADGVAQGAGETWPAEE